MLWPTSAASHFIQAAAGGAMPTSAGVAPYAAFGALYFAVAAIALAVASRRRLAREI